MLEQINTAVTFFAFYTESKVGKTGLTVAIDVYKRTASASIQIVTSGGAIELGGGLYLYQLSSGLVDVEAEYIAIFKTATSTVDLRHIPALWVIGRAGVENLDASISSRLAAASYIAPVETDDPWAISLPGDYEGGTAGAILGNMESNILGDLSSTEITLVSPLLEGGVLELVAGDAYDLDHGRALDDWVFPGQPSLVDATVTLVIDGALSVEATSVGGAGTGTQTPVFELTAADTAQLTRIGERSYRYQIQAMWSADDPIQPAVLTRGDVTVIERAAS
jgi:hypothetical protein